MCFVERPCVSTKGVRVAIQLQAAGVFLTSSMSPAWRQASSFRRGRRPKRIGKFSRKFCGYVHAVARKRKCTSRRPRQCDDGLSSRHIEEGLSSEQVEAAEN